MGTKSALKKAISEEQGGVCDLSGVDLKDDQSLNDSDRKRMKSEGGNYDPANTRVVEPRAHMARHKALRFRPKAMRELKSMVDDRNQVMRVYYKINNQLLAFKRHTDEANPETVEFLTAQRDAIKPVLNDRTARVTKAIKAYAKHDRLVEVALAVPYLGPITVAVLTVYVDLTKAESVSALWKYAGLHTASHLRYTKGETSGGNKKVRTAVRLAAESHVKGGADAPYNSIYYRDKARREVSEALVASRTRDGKRIVTIPWKDTMPSHRHGAALRAVEKHILADYWFVGRELLGLSTRPLYVEEKLGHTGIVRPRERGWDW